MSRGVNRGVNRAWGPLLVWMILVPVMLVLMIAGCVQGPDLSDLSTRAAALEEECQDLQRQLDTRRRSVPDTPVVQKETAPDPPAFRRELGYRLVAEADALVGSVSADADETAHAVRALRGLLVLEQRTDVLVDIIERGSSAGQLYGLLALYYVDRDRYESFMPRYRVSSEPVDFAYIGSYLKTLPTREVVKEYVKDPEFRHGVIASDWALSGLEFEGEFDLDVYTDALRQADTRVPVLIERLIAAGPDFEPEVCEALAVLCPVAPKKTIPAVLELAGHEMDSIREQANELLVVLAPWAAEVLDRVLVVLEKGNEDAVIDIVDLILQDEFWRHAPFGQVADFLDPGFRERCRNPMDGEDYSDVCQIVLDAVLERRDVHRAPRILLTRLLVAADEEQSERVLGLLLAQGREGTLRLLELHESGDARFRRSFLEALRKPTIRPWLPAAVEMLLVPRAK